jgi:hypothetical protein
MFNHPFPFIFYQLAFSLSFFVFNSVRMWCRAQSESGHSIKLLSLPRTKGAVKEGMLRASGE